MDEDKKINPIYPGSTSWASTVNNNFILTEERLTNLEAKPAAPGWAGVFLTLMFMLIVSATILGVVWLMTT